MGLIVMVFQFNLDVEETDALREKLQPWRNCDVATRRPGPMIIETYLDLKDLTNKQTLLARDEQGRKWDVEEALNPSPDSAEEHETSSNTQVILERWIVRLGDPTSDLPNDIAPLLPRTYKNCIVLFRSLYFGVRLLPAWELGKKSSHRVSSVPKLRHRILQMQDVQDRGSVDPLATPLYVGNEDVLRKITFGSIESPAGALSIQVSYRAECDFHIENSEEALSSRFMGMEEQDFEPSLGRRQDSGRKHGHQRTVSAEIGSLPSRHHGLRLSPDAGQAYGSLSTFHQLGPQMGTSPISALRAAQIPGSLSPPEDTAIRKAPPTPRSAQGSRSSLRSADGGQGIGRRPSVSFMPFKSPSLSASPRQSEQAMTSIPKSSLGKSSPLATLAEARNPLGHVPTSRGSPTINEMPMSVPESSKPPGPNRFSSSFSHRKGKLSVGGGSKTEDDASSGKASIISSNAQPGSGVLAEGGASSGSLQTDDDNISDFLKLLDQKKDLRSFRSSSETTNVDQSKGQPSGALNKFQRMKDSNVALSESMSSSLVLHRSSTSSSQRISSVPAMVAGTSMSVSTSPGKPISPHTPHTPAIPSRLSANSIVDYSAPAPTVEEMHEAGTTALSQDPSQRAPRDPSTGPIDIPTSPRPYHPSYRRSSSAAHRRSAPRDEEEMFPFGMRSASLGVDDDRPPLNLNALASGLTNNTHLETETAPPVNEQSDLPFSHVFDATEPEIGRGRHGSSGSREETTALRARGGPYRPRIGRGSGRGDTPPQDSSSSLVERGSGSGASDQRGGRHSSSRPASHFEDEEPLFFAMSDFGATQQQPLRRSFEESRGGGDSSGSSRRGSRRGGY